MGEDEGIYAPLKIVGRCLGKGGQKFERAQAQAGQTFSNPGANDNGILAETASYADLAANVAFVSALMYHEGAS